MQSRYAGTKTPVKIPSLHWQGATCWRSIARTTPQELMEKFVSLDNDDYIKHLSENGHSYVVVQDNIMTGCGTVMPFWGKETEECVLPSIYALPEY